MLCVGGAEVLACGQQAGYAEAMADQTLSVESARTMAEALMHDRLQLVERHTRNVLDEGKARDALKDAERVSARSWADLLAAGWTPEELKKMKFKEPEVKAPGRPRGHVRGANKNTSAASASSAAVEIPGQPAHAQNPSAPEPSTAV